MHNYLSLKNIPKHYQVVMAGWVSRMLMGFSQIISIPILMNYLGVDLYAVFAVIIGLQGWFVLADYGIGSSLQNYISEARVNNKDIKLLLNNAAVVTMVLLIVSCIIFVCISPLLQRLLLHKIDPVLAASRSSFFNIIGLICIATAVFGISYRILFAHHKGYLAYFYQGLGSVISVIAIIIVNYLNINQNKLLVILLCWLLPNLFVAMISYVQNFAFKGMFKYIDPGIIKAMLTRGVKFWGFAIVAAATLSVDYIIMAQTLTAQDVAIYSILSKGFGFILFFYSAILTAIWPELAEMFAKKQWLQANKTLSKNIFLGIFFVLICSVLFLLFRSLIVHILANGKNLTLPIATIGLFGIYIMLRVWTDSYAMALQSQSFLKIFWICVPTQAALSIIGMYIFSKYFGINGILMGLIASFVLTVTWALPMHYFKRKRISERSYAV